MATREIILINPSLCTGCRACEVACGFRRTKEMDPSQGLIRVGKDEATGKREITIGEKCDACRDLEEPFCLQVCQPRALSLGRKLV